MNSSWSLTACGQSGPVEIDFLSSASAEERWLCELRSPSAYLTFEISDPSDIRKFAGFVQRLIGMRKFEEERVGRFSGCDVFIVKDDEFGDRFFLRVRGDCVCFELKFRDLESSALSAALKSLAADLP